MLAGRTSMRAAVLTAHGDPGCMHLTDVPFPKAQEDGVVVRVLACGLNRGLDGRTRKDGAGRNIIFPQILGSEIVGEICEVAPAVHGWSVGDRVVVVPWQACGTCRNCREGNENACPTRRMIGIDLPGGNAEFVAVKANGIIKLPNSHTPPLIEAAALAITYTTAFHMLVARARVSQRDTVVVLGAAGAVGRATVQIAKCLGAKVVAVVSTAEKAATLKRSGADHVIIPSDNHFSARVFELTGGFGADVVVDHIGTDTWPESIASVAPNGRIAICGATSGNHLSFDARPLWRKCISFLFSNSGTIEDMRKVLAMWAAGRFPPLHLTAVPLEHIERAHIMLDDRRLASKLILLPNAGDPRECP